MKKRVYKLPFLSKIAWFIADILPNRVRAALFIEAYMSLDDHYKSITTAKEKDGSYSMFSAIDAIRVETLRREVFTDGLKATLEDKL